jgi:hypothetical protein
VAWVMLVYLQRECGIKIGFWLDARILFAVTHTILKLVIGSNKLICHSSSGGQKQGCFCHYRIEDTLCKEWSKFMSQEQEVGFEYKSSNMESIIPQCIPKKIKGLDMRVR